MSQVAPLATVTERIKIPSKSLQEQLGEKTKEFAAAIQKQNPRAVMDSSGNSNRKRKLYNIPGTQSSPYNKKSTFGQLMVAKIVEMSPKAYSKHVKAIRPNELIDSKKTNG